MHWLRVGNMVVNLAQVTDVDLNVRAGAKTPPMVAINFAALALIDGEMEGRTVYFSGEDAKAIRGYFRGLSGKQLTTLTTYEETGAPPEVTTAPFYCPGCGVLPELCQCQPKCSAYKADSGGTLKKALELLEGKCVY